MGTGAQQGVVLDELEDYADALCLYSHWEFLRNRDPYEKGRADAYADILEYIAGIREVPGSCLYTCTPATALP